MARSPASPAKSWSRPTSSAGKQSSRTVVGDFEFAAGAVIVTSGGIGGNHDLVRKVWPVDAARPGAEDGWSPACRTMSTAA